MLESQCLRGQKEKYGKFGIDSGFAIDKLKGI